MNRGSLQGSRHHGDLLTSAATACAEDSLVSDALPFNRKKRESIYKFKSYKIGRFLLLAFSRARSSEGHHSTQATAA